MEGHFDHGILVANLPEPFRLRPGVEFAYRGACKVAIEGVAIATRHHFSVGANGVQRLIVVQFERFVSADGSYTFALPDPIELGNALYGRWAFELRVDDERKERPGKEMDATAAHFERLGIALPNRHAVARFARAIGSERRHEVIVFVHECGPDAALEGILDRALGAFSLE
jgi:hypothetical protein